MSKELYIRGKKIVLGAQIGKGGEGEVFTLANDKSKAVKIYTGKYDVDRESKVRTMVDLRLAAGSMLVSFPEDLATTKSGAFAGFTMRVVRDHRPIHELYSVKSRKVHFPRADYRFLVRTAANTAKAIAQAHELNCVIGDINHSGILVSEAATVALIDADSFQIQANGKVFPCLVGVPEFTPPELQGCSLRGVSRAKVHDYFGLAVAIFQLLLMGRHPYAGIQKSGDDSLEDLIKKNLFAYSRKRSVGLIPPPGVPALEAFPAELADAFERAFGVNPTLRPSASEWITLLQALEGRLTRCSVNAMHYSPNPGGCIWCKMERSSGVVLFLTHLTSLNGGSTLASDFDVEKIWSSIKAVPMPSEQFIRPRLATGALLPSPIAEAANGNIRKRRIIAVVCSVAVIGLWGTFPSGGLLWLGGLIWIIALLWGQGPLHADWNQRYLKAEEEFASALKSWHKKIGFEALHSLRRDLERAVTEFRGLAQAKVQAVNRLTSGRQSRQLEEYLDRFLIKTASISGIGPGKKVTLISFGIESAADVTYSAVTSIRGFGPATANKLLDWRRQHENTFKYNPAPTAEDARAVEKLEAEFATKLGGLSKQISSGHLELLRRSNTIQQLMKQEDQGLSRAATALNQIKVDMQFLGLSIPVSPPNNTVAFTQSSGVTTPSSQQVSVSSVCPACGSLMIRRVARRGFRKGNSFWGCTRFPNCRGTRP